ncbi:PTS sugar transporter subunit IIA [Lacticaseibacillus pantheris]|uniref:PTS sugar transporter subunit IIA n=1 Tax=Lacticaseibacillus pantheris TaxID=171523 RepID=UPI0026594E05|nr:fructose PTS transporter subunit IIA [Lacticaseibacillus pantheris]WKF85885.1 fructose PTS transporter subunit IIA [Lacticaseibacillus pantheris]
MKIKLNKKLVVYKLNAQNRKDAISQLADRFVQQGIVTDKHAYLDAVEIREAEGTTGIGDGIAIPHGETSAVTDSSVAVAELKRPLEWQAMDGNPVKYVFLLAVPQNGDVEHLKILSELASELMDDDVRERLSKVTSVDDLMRVF